MKGLCFDRLTHSFDNVFLHIAHELAHTLLVFVAHLDHFLDHALLLKHGVGEMHMHEGVAAK